MENYKFLQIIDSEKWSNKNERNSSLLFESYKCTVYYPIAM